MERAGGAVITLGSNGLAMNGGNGIDGQTLLAWLDPIEMGGTLLLEAVGVTLSPGSNGILAGFFNGNQTAADCTAGFQATAQQGTGDVTLQPIVKGTAAGTTFAVNSANNTRCAFAFIARKVSARGRCITPLAITGRSARAASGCCAGQPPDGSSGVRERRGRNAGDPLRRRHRQPARALHVVPASSINLIGTMRAINLTNLGSGWVVSTPPSGGAYTRRMGTTAEAAECYVERTGKLVFYTGYTPAAGEQIAVSYRTIGSAVGRAVNTASQQALAQPDRRRWPRGSAR